MKRSMVVPLALESREVGEENEVKVDLSRPQEQRMNRRAARSCIDDAALHLCTLVEYTVCS